MGRTVNSALDDVDLSPAGYRVLGYLATGVSAATVLAAKLAVSRPSVTAAVDALVLQGFVTRSPDAEDRRKVSISLTPAGEAALGDADELIAARLVLVGETLSEADARTVFDALDRLHDALNVYRANLHDQLRQSGQIE